VIERGSSLFIKRVADLEKSDGKSRSNVLVDGGVSGMEASPFDSENKGGGGDDDVAIAPQQIEMERIIEEQQ